VVRVGLLALRMGVIAVLVIALLQPAWVRTSVKVVGTEPIAVLPAELVDQPGFYSVDQHGKGAPAMRSSAPGVVAVNVPRTESDPRVLDIENVRRCAGRWQLQRIETVEAGASRAAAEETIADLLASGRTSQGVWNALLWMVLALVFVEPLIANGIFSFMSAGRGSEM